MFSILKSKPSLRKSYSYLIFITSHLGKGQLCAPLFLSKQHYINWMLISKMFEGKIT